MFLLFLILTIFFVTYFISYKRHKKEQEQKALDKSIAELDNELRKLDKDRVTGKDIDKVLNFLSQNGVINSQEYNYLYSKSLPYRKK